MKEIESILVMEYENPKKFKRLQQEYSQNFLLEIARAGDGNNLTYIICDYDYPYLLWGRDYGEIIGGTVLKLLL